MDVKRLQAQVYDFIFQLLDNEPEFTGMNAGDIASRCERTFQAAMEDCLWRTDYTAEGAEMPLPPAGKVK